ncbi:MAG TPA: hypothetical protein VFK02_02430 [Kofleriaceae bacterium]|nr:hypothetical protein [Kofleriaceae bacterium]
MQLQVDRAIWHEVFAVARRYDDDRPGLGDEFIDAFPPIQRFVMDRFPYAIGYQVMTGAVVVLVVAHAKRRPGYWR